MKSFSEQLEVLCGQPAKFSIGRVRFPKGGLGHSQINEALIANGFGRISEPFFAFFSTKKDGYEPGMTIDSLESFHFCVEVFIKHAMLRYGNIKFAYKKMSVMDEYDIEEEIEWAAPRLENSFIERHDAIHPIVKIDPEHTYLLGYIVDAEIKKLSESEGSRQQVEELTRMAVKYRGIGRSNHNAYLTSDHMDVYVATSMRKPHEFLAVSKLCDEIFGEKALAELNPRYFDPTQAYCPDRIDKGISEALMLKRAKCTIYLAQESDTFGKDSELASTLAQGKPVIAFVPEYTAESAREELELLLSAPSVTESSVAHKQMLLDFAMSLNPTVAWDNRQVRGWIDSDNESQYEKIYEFVIELMIKHYNKRANTLSRIHPLGVQVHLEDGVANGVLVARTVEQCSKLVRQILLNELDFDIERDQVDGDERILLREKMTNSVFRVVSSDKVLTTAFWNHYLPHFMVK